MCLGRLEKKNRTHDPGSKPKPCAHDQQSVGPTIALRTAILKFHFLSDAIEVIIKMIKGAENLDLMEDIMDFSSYFKTSTFSYICTNQDGAPIVLQNLILTKEKVLCGLNRF